MLEEDLLAAAKNVKKVKNVKRYEDFCKALHILYRYVTFLKTFYIVQGLWFPVSYLIFNH